MTDRSTLKLATPIAALLVALATACDSEDSDRALNTGGTGGSTGSGEGGASGGGTGGNAGTAGSSVGGSGAGGSGATGGGGGSAGTGASGGLGGSAGSGGGGTLTLLAGEPGGAGYTDGVGDAARFRFPAAVASDGNGILYVADPTNMKIRRVDIATRTVTSPYDLFGPKALAADGAGKLYVGNGTAVFEFDLSTDTRTLIAGDENMSGTRDGVGTAARFSSMSAMVYDGSDHLYIAEPDEHRIRRLTLSTRSVEQFVGMAGQEATVDGTGTAARFRLPAGLEFAAGKLYVTDIQGATVREVDVSTGAVTTLAGVDQQWGTVDDIGSAARLADPNAIWEHGGTLYVGEYSAIRAIDPSTGAVSTVAGLPALRGRLPVIEDGVGAAASFGSLFGATTDGGKAYFVDGDGHAVRSFDPGDGSVATVAGKLPSLNVTDGALGTGRFAEPLAMAGDGADRVFIADVQGHRIRLYDRSAGQVTTLAGTTGGYQDGPAATAQFLLPRAVAFDGVDGLYVFGGTNTIRKIDLTAQMVTTVAGQNAQSGTVDGVGAAARLSFAAEAAFDGTDTIYFIEGAGAVRRFNITTSEVTTWLTSVTGCEGPEAIAVTADAVYLGERGTICRVQLSDSSVTTLPQVGANARALFTGPNNTLYVAGSGSLVQVDLTTQMGTKLLGDRPLQVQLGGPGTARLNYPSAGLTLPDGTLLLLDREEHVLLSWQ